MEDDRMLYRGDQCSPECPYLKEYEHPYFVHTAWCERLERELDWYDYYVAACKFN